MLALEDTGEIKDLQDQRENAGMVEMVVMEYRVSREMWVFKE